ncbi:MAG: hypothetical protein AAF799_02135 [Myxococcota bacterium]
MFGLGKRWREWLDEVRSDYGRQYGWFVERNGTPIAILLDPQWVDMFWDSYRVHPVPGSNLPDMIYTAELWHAGDLVYRNRATGEVVGAWAGGALPTRDDPRVVMRGLYLHRRFTLLDGLVRWWQTSRPT